MKSRRLTRRTTRAITTVRAAESPDDRLVAIAAQRLRNGDALGALRLLQQP